ncbi:MAG: glycoside hydrolase family 81, partial [Planctomycetes bacterium]|nr:glycoside hydrolase family 81 [Planctomycetota bacterium]
ALFARYAYAHVTDTKIAWQYDPKSSTVRTTFTFTTKPHEGQTTDTLFALYPHQWRYAPIERYICPLGSVRGVMKLAAGSSFTTEVPFCGVLPSLPLAGNCDKRQLDVFLDREAERPREGAKDTYWEGKHLGRLATLAPLAEQSDNTNAAAAFHKELRQRLENWFTATNPRGEVKSFGVFYYDDRWGSLIGYPASYGSDVDLNDHHFHYGYFIRAAAELARVDPQWAASDRWGSMVELLVRDIAAPKRDDPKFPFLRNFDPYAGHSWASGHAKFADGNNNESSSEAMNAWCAMILWGQATGDVALRDLGIFLYTTEMTAIHEYWFDVHDENHPADYAPAVVTMVWGGKGANETWFSANPEAVYGINWLPLHGGSLYPQDALKQYNAQHEKYPAEAGNSQANTYAWLHAMDALGHVDRTVTADYPLVAVFGKGDRRSYIVYNMENGRRTVTFSDGTKVSADGKGFVVQHEE